MESPTNMNFTGCLVKAPARANDWRSVLDKSFRTRTAAVAGASVPTTMTATVATVRAMDGVMALIERQNVPYMTGRSTR